MTVKSILVAIACLGVLSFAALPEMRITTKNNAEPQSRDGGSCQGAWTAATGTHIFDYITVTNFQLTGSSADLTKAPAIDDSIYIRLRGNSTADNAKKPYRIKFDKKVSLIDRNKEPAKSWVLLANYYDGTFALNAMAFELGKRLGLNFTNSSQLVDLYINNQYKGIYQLTEQIQSNKRSVDLRDKNGGWLVEFDYHAPASDECLRAFTANKYSLTTFIKAPELDDTDNPNDSTQLRFVKNDINALVNKMEEGGFPTNGYRDMIDLESFAKYVLIQLVMDNFDFNSKTQTGGLPGSNFAYKIDASSKIQAGPLWDFDLAAGVQNSNSFCFQNCPPGFPSHYQSYQDPVAPTSQDYSHAFYKRLWADPVFKAKYKKLWDKCKSDFQSMSTFIDQIKTQVEGSIQGKGTNTWANNSMYMSGALTTQQFNTEVSNLKTWWTNRLNYVDQQLSSISTSADTGPEPTTACNTGSSGSIASSSSLASSSSSTTSSGNANCDYQASWCGSNTPTNNTTTKPTIGQCVFVKDYTALTISGGGGIVLINGTTCTGSSTNCVTNKPVAKDGGYYIYVQEGNLSGSQPYTVTAGTPVCGTTPILTPAITLSNLPQGAKIEVYNLQGKLIYSTTSHSPLATSLNIGVQPKGVYIIRIKQGNSTPTYQNRIYLN